MKTELELLQKRVGKNFFYCPICKICFEGSEYLKTAIPNPKTLWLANMVTHSRHKHIKYWNKCWEENGISYRRGWFKDYDFEKQKVNERVKRQILRKCKDYMKSIRFKMKDLLQLQVNSEETIALFEKLTINN